VPILLAPRRDLYGPRNPASEKTSSPRCPRGGPRFLERLINFGFWSSHCCQGCGNATAMAPRMRAPGNTILSVTAGHHLKLDRIPPHARDPLHNGLGPSNQFDGVVWSSSLYARTEASDEMNHFSFFPSPPLLPESSYLVSLRRELRFWGAALLHNNLFFHFSLYSVILSFLFFSFFAPRVGLRSENPRHGLTNPLTDIVLRLYGSRTRLSS